VVECVHEESGRSNSVSAYKSWNVPNRKQNRRVEDLSGVNLDSASIIDGAIYCKVVVDPVLKVEDSTYDLDNNDYFVLLAAGASLKSTKIVAKLEMKNSGVIKKILTPCSVQRWLPRRSVHK